MFRIFCLCLHFFASTTTGTDTGATPDGAIILNEHGSQQRRMLSDCNCDQYQISKHSESWYNKKWTKATGKICGGKPVYKGSSDRFLIYDEGQRRWEFSDGSCKVWRNWFAGAKGVECPSDNPPGWKATCTRPVTVAATTTTTTTTTSTTTTTAATTTTITPRTTSKPGE